MFSWLIIVGCWILGFVLLLSSFSLGATIDACIRLGAALGAFAFGDSMYKAKRKLEATKEFRSQ